MRFPPIPLASIQRLRSLRSLSVASRVKDLRTILSDSAWIVEDFIALPGLSLRRFVVEM